MIRKFVDSSFCLERCRCCCKFSEPESPWSPCFLKEELAALNEKGVVPPLLEKSKKIRLKALSEKEDSSLPGHIGQIYVCPFLDAQNSRCAIYSGRPLECRIYPFLINRRADKVFLSVDLGCPFVKDKTESEEFKKHLLYLYKFFNAPKQVKLLKSNPQVIQSYSDARDLMELKL